MIVIKELSTGDAMSYKSFFMQGLREDEHNFRIAPEDEQDAPFPTEGREDSFTLAAWEEQRLAGIVSFEREGRQRCKLRHKGLLFRMYVSPSFRGQGIGRKLIIALLEKAGKLENLEQINLTVVAGNDTARKLYQGFGFRTFSLEKNAIKWKGQYFDEETMVLFLRQP